MFQRYLGVQAGAVRALVEYAEAGQGVDVLDAAGQITFAGHGQDESGLVLDHDASGNGAACGNGHFDAVGIADIQQAGNGALAASFAVTDIVGQTDFASAVLQAMGHEHQHVLGLISFALSQDEFVVDLDERGPDFGLGYTQESSQHGHQGEKYFE